MLMPQDDQVWMLYYNYYPKPMGWRRWMAPTPDELEMETLQMDLQKEVHSSRSVELHASVTLGELAKLLEL
jgi:hypothetical protein